MENHPEINSKSSVVHIDSMNGVLKLHIPTQYDKDNHVPILYSVNQNGMEVCGIMLIYNNRSNMDSVVLSYDMRNPNKWMFKIMNDGTGETAFVYVTRHKSQEEKFKVYKSGYMYGFEDIVNFIEEEADSVTLSMNDRDTYTLKKSSFFCFF